MKLSMVFGAFVGSMTYTAITHGPIINGLVGGGLAVLTMTLLNKATGWFE